MYEAVDPPLSDSAYNSIKEMAESGLGELTLEILGYTYLLSPLILIDDSYKVQRFLNLIQASSVNVYLEYFKIISKINFWNSIIRTL